MCGAHGGHTELHRQPVEQAGHGHRAGLATWHPPTDAEPHLFRPRARVSHRRNAAARRVRASATCTHASPWRSGCAEAVDRPADLLAPATSVALCGRGDAGRSHRRLACDRRERAAHVWCAVQGARRHCRGRHRRRPVPRLWRRRLHALHGRPAANDARLSATARSPCWNRGCGALGRRPPPRE